MKTPRFWQHNNLLSALLIPVSFAYRIGAWADRTFTTPQRAVLPVISIGNATAGGAGKTPTTLALVPLLRTLGHTPHILTRGYKGTASNAHRVTASDSWQQVGDEALLLANAAPTWVGSDRLLSAEAAAQNGATILLCDDALQHHRLQKSLSFLVIDGPYGIGNGQLLPAGPLREPFAAAVKHAHAVILIGDDAHHVTSNLTIPVFRADLKPSGDTGFLADHRWIAFAGIGRPKKFYGSLRQLGADIAATHDFPDHHAYNETDCAALLAMAEKSDAHLITTEKDWVKLPPALHGKVRVLSVQLTLENPPVFHQFLANSLKLSP